jgi:hypothetical protein
LHDPLAMVTMRCCRLDGQGCHVHHRVFPDLRIDQPAKGQRKGAVEQALAGFGLVAHHGGVDDMGLATGKGAWRWPPAGAMVGCLPQGGCAGVTIA